MNTEDVCATTLRDLDKFKAQLNEKDIDIPYLESLISSFKGTIKGGNEFNTKLLYMKIEYVESVLELINEAHLERQKKVMEAPQEISDEDIAKKFIQIKKSAERRDKEFNLSLKEIKRLLNRKTCYFTGTKIYKGDEKQGTDPLDIVRTFDRLDSEKGYIIGNVVACSHFANQLKNTLFESPKGVALGKEKLVKKMMEKL